MKKRKKKNDDIDKYMFNINENIIKIENQLVYKVPEINIINTSSQMKNNIEYIQKSFTIIKNNIFTKLINILNIDANNKYYFIKTFNKKFFSTELLKSKINKYFQILTDDYVIHYDLLLGLIKDDNCIPFWNDNIKSMSKKLFLPIKKNLELINKPKTFDSDTWFKTEHFMYNDLNPETIDIETKKERKFNDKYIDKKTSEEKYVIKSRKIKMYLTEKQKEYLTRIYGAYRYFYNRAIQYINNYDKKTQKTKYYIQHDDESTVKTVNLKDVKLLFDYKTMRKYLKEESTFPVWLNNIKMQSHLIDNAFREASQNYTSCMEKYKKYKIPFDLKVKNKKSKYQTINIEKTMLKKETNTLFPGIKTKVNNKNVSIFLNIKLSEDISKYDICDSSITCNMRLNEYYINLNYHDNSTRNKRILLNKKICSIDPGLSCLLNVYEDNYVHFIGSDILKPMLKICKEVDIINSRINKKEGKNYKLNNNKRRNMKKAMHRKIKYLDNLKSELHNKCIKYLCDNYGKIILPKLETQEMAKKFNSKLARSLYNISYNSFLSKLKLKCKENNIELVIRPEYYTSKICTRCGNIKHDLKLSDRIYKCNCCNLSINRDLNAARNIMLRNNIEWELPPSGPVNLT